MIEEEFHKPIEGMEDTSEVVDNNLENIIQNIQSSRSQLNLEYKDDLSKKILEIDEIVFKFNEDEDLKDENMK